MPRHPRLSLRAALAVTMLLAAAPPARAETVDGDRIVIIDGDTIALPCPDLGLCRQERVRILNIDAPETRGAACDAERIAGLAAREALARLLRGKAVAVTRCEPEAGRAEKGEPAFGERAGKKPRCQDRYRRTLARLATASGDVGHALIATGHALPWAPGPQAKFERQQHWCGGAR